MSTTELVFFIILSVSASLVFLAMAALCLYAIAILKQVKRLTRRAENVADTVESAAFTFEKVASPLALFKIIAKIVERASKSSRRG